jgi:GDP-L-fucose synthase
VNIEGKKILVTGGAGFLGRHVCEELSAHGARPVPVRSHDYDLRQRASIDRMLEDVRPDAVIHLAAVVGGIGANLSSPGRFFYENAIMGIELIEACRLAPVGKVVIAGTVCAYPKIVALPFSEDDLWSGYPEETNAPYGLAKKVLLVQAQAYRQEYGFNAIYLLPVNLYGPFDNMDPQTSHVIPGMIEKFVRARHSGARSVLLWGDGTPTREFLYVRDAATAFRLALEHYDGAEPVNIGAGEEISIRDLAMRVASVVGYGGRIAWDQTKPNGQPRRKLDTTRAAQLFGFRSSTSFDEGLRATVGWYADEIAAQPARAS